MKKYGNIPFNRRVVAFVCLLFLAVTVLIPRQVVSASGSSSSSSTFIFKYLYYATPDSEAKNMVSTGTLSYTGGLNVRSYIIEHAVDDKSYKMDFGFVSSTPLDSFSFSLNSIDCTSEIMKREYKGVYFYILGNYSYTKSADIFTGSSSDIFYLRATGKDCNDIDVLRGVVADYVKTGVKSDGMIIGGSDTHPTDVTNESIGYLQDVKLNLSYITPIKGDSNFETTNYQIYTDMIYNLKWNNKKTSTNYDLSSSYVQLYAKAEYSKSEYDKVSATDFIELGDYEKASKGKLKFSFMELFEKSNNCKSAYLSAFPLSSADYKNGKLIACSVTSNIKYKFYIRVYKGTDKGPWLCVSEKGSHHSNEFVNSGVKVPFNVSSGDLDSDGTYKPDGNINENGNGITGTGKDKDDADADTNANDKIQTKHDSSDNSVWDNLENLVSGIASVPIIIKDIFSFLPSWCLNVTATGFALMITVCVIKFIRGK